MVGRDLPRLSSLPLWRITKGSGSRLSLSAWERHQLSNGTCLRQLREGGVLVAPSAAHTHLGHREILVGIFEVSQSECQLTTKRHRCIVGTSNSTTNKARSFFAFFFHATLSNIFSSRVVRARTRAAALSRFRDLVARVDRWSGVGSRVAVQYAEIGARRLGVWERR